MENRTVKLFVLTHFRFFSEYSPWLPILDARLSPNMYYQQSPLLFWAVIGTACRSYTQNPTLMNALTKDIVQSALLSVTSSRAPLQRLQAFLLLVTWPLADAVETDQQETIFVLVGLLLHLGLRSGLHVPSGSDEFFRVKMPNLPDIGMAGRAELWTHCVLAYQRSDRFWVTSCISLTLVEYASVKALFPGLHSIYLLKPNATKLNTILSLHL